MKRREFVLSALSLPFAHRLLANPPAAYGPAPSRPHLRCLLEIEVWIRRLSVALGSQPQGLRAAGVSHVLLQSIARAAHELWSDFRDLLRWREWRRRLLWRGVRATGNRQPHLLRLAGD